jgi:N-acetylglutamate synthase-like GNAT family acetyltransferase
MANEFHIRQATSSDLPEINEVIRASVMSWPLAERVKRLSLNVLTYDQTDYEHYQFIVAEHQAEIVAVAAWDPDHEDSLFHGLYVSPDLHARGIGRQLINEVIKRVRALGRNKLVVKAESVSANYFVKQGFEAIPVLAPNDYPYLFQKHI